MTRGSSTALVVAAALLLSACLGRAQWRGDAPFARGEWAAAASSYERQLSTAPTADDRDLALYRLALAYLAGTNPDKRTLARTALERLRRDYPDSDAAADAVALLARLDELDAVARTLATLREQRDASRMAVERLGELATALKDRAENTEGKLGTSEEERERLQKRVNQLEATAAQQRTTIAELSASIERLTEQLNALKSIDLDKPARR